MLLLFLLHVNAVAFIYFFCSAKHSCLENLLQIQFCYSYFGTMIFSFWQKRVGSIILNAQNPCKELNYLVLKNISIPPKAQIEN